MRTANRRSRPQGRPENAHPGHCQDRHHRALQAQGIVRRGVSHRDVPGGGIRAPRGRRHGAPVGLETCSLTAST